MNVLLDVAGPTASGQSQELTALIGILLFIAFVGILMWIGYSESTELEEIDEDMDVAYID
jgi:hypothetical protein